MILKLLELSETVQNHRSLSDPLDLSLTVHSEGGQAPLPVPPETPSSSSSEEQLVTSGGGREGPLADEPAAAGVFVHLVNIVDGGDDVGLGHVRVEEIGDGGENVLEGDLVEERTMINQMKQ